MDQWIPATGSFLSSVVGWKTVWYYRGGSLADILGKSSEGISNMSVYPRSPLRKFC